MVTDARGHEVPADSDMWGYREDMGLLSASIADVRSVADQAAADALVADLVASDIDPTGLVAWLGTPGTLSVYDGTAWKAYVSEEWVQTKFDNLKGIAQGTAHIEGIKTGSAKTLLVTFPSGTFTRAPYITLGIYSTTAGNRFASHANKTATSFTMVGGYLGASDTIDMWISWHAIRDGGNAVVAFSAPEALAFGPAEPSPDATVTCPTDGCTNQGIPLEIISTWVDEETGVSHPVDAVQCGVCNADITDTLAPIEEA